MPAPGHDAARSCSRARRAARAVAPSRCSPPRTSAARAAEQALGFAGAEPTAAERAAAIERLAAAAPERQLWDDLQALPAATDPGFLAAAKAIGAQDAVLVDAMRTRGALPAGDGRRPRRRRHARAAEQRDLRVAHLAAARRAGGRVRVRVLNRDGFAHRVSALALHDREPRPGRRTTGAASPGRRCPAARTSRAGEAATVELDLPADAFTLWLGDDGTGDQAATLIELEQGPRMQSVTPTADVSATPLHQAMDAAGDHWVTLAGRRRRRCGSRPAADLADSARASFLIPGGRHTADSAAAAARAVGHRASTTAASSGRRSRSATASRASTPPPPRTARPRACASTRCPPCGDDECPAVFPPDPGRAPHAPAAADEGHPGRAGQHARVVHGGQRRPHRPAARGARRHASSGRRTSPAAARRRSASGSTRPATCGSPRASSNRIGRLTPDVEPALRRRRRAARATTAIPERRARRRARAVAGARCSPPTRTPSPSTGAASCGSPRARRASSATSTRSSRATARRDGIGRDRPARTRTSARAPTPADLTVDRAGTVFWADEYGDIVGTVLTRGRPRRTGGPGRSFRPAARRSLTDSPLVDPAGDLWFLEAGANRITRVSGVQRGQPRRGAAARRRRSTRPRTSSPIAGLDEATAVDVRVLRDGGEVGPRGRASP